MDHNNKPTKDVYLIISRNIKKYRKIAQITQQELALKTGYSYAYIRRLEAPKCIKNFSIQTIYHIARALNVDIGKLFIDDDI